MTRNINDELATWAVLGPERTIVRQCGKVIYDGVPGEVPPDIQKLIDELPLAIDSLSKPASIVPDEAHADPR